MFYSGVFPPFVMVTSTYWQFACFFITFWLILLTIIKFRIVHKLMFKIWILYCTGAPGEGWAGAGTEPGFPGSGGDPHQNYRCHKKVPVPSQIHSISLSVYVLVLLCRPVFGRLPALSSGVKVALRICFPFIIRLRVLNPLVSANFFSNFDLKFGTQV